MSYHVNREKTDESNTVLRLRVTVMKVVKTLGLGSVGRSVVGSVGTVVRSVGSVVGSMGSVGRRLLLLVVYRDPTPPGKSWILFLVNSRTWKVLENCIGPGKSWKNILESHAASCWN